MTEKNDIEALRNEAYGISRLFEAEQFIEKVIVMLEAERQRVDANAQEIGKLEFQWEHRAPTQWAYDQACTALHAQRERAEKAEAELAAIRGTQEPVGVIKKDNDAVYGYAHFRKALPVGTELFTYPPDPVFDKKANIEAAHALSDVRRFIEAKFMTVADLPSVEGVLLKGPECKHEADAIIAALNLVADFYENQLKPVVDLTNVLKVPYKISGQSFAAYDSDDLHAALEAAQIVVKGGE